MKENHLGLTGLKVSCAGFGVLPMGPNQLALSIDEGAAILKNAIERGITFIDTAQYYKTYPYIKRALEGISEPPVICSKSLERSYEGMMDAIAEARRELSLDVIDVFLMHEVRSGGLGERPGAWQALIDAKKQGLVKAIGLSTHHVDITEEAALIPELDVVFPLLNYAGLGIRRGNEFASAEDMEKAIALCRKHGKGVFTMKAFGGGNLTSNYRKALDYIFSVPGIDSVMIGFGSVRELDDLFAYLGGEMDESYNPDVSNKKVHISQDDCEGCGACKAACPAGAIFYNENGLAQVDHSICLTCGYCSPVCPVRAVIMY
ncbi:MAG: aldo/keto reductase [Oscillospiraceae bacterium]|nr:aldo/keto reductase [Oscillospiraceae bacterium]